MRCPDRTENQIESLTHLNDQIERERVDELAEHVFGGSIHAQRVASLADGIDGVLHSAQLGIRAIGAGLAVANGLTPRHAIKQIDRLFSNESLEMSQLFKNWVRFVVAMRDEIIVNFDWTEFDDSDKKVRMKRTDRRDWLFLLATLAHTLLVLLGRAGRELNLDRWLGASKPGGLSLFRMGHLLYRLIPSMEETRLKALMECYDRILACHDVCHETHGII